MANTPTEPPDPPSREAASRSTFIAQGLPVPVVWLAVVASPGTQAVAAAHGAARIALTLALAVSVVVVTAAFGLLFPRVISPSMPSLTDRRDYTRTVLWPFAVSVAVTGALVVVLARVAATSASGTERSALQAPI